MKIAFFTYFGLFSKTGGLQNQIHSTKDALISLGHEVIIITDSNTELNDFDLFHVFALTHGNYSIINHLSSYNKPIILSPVIQSLDSEFLNLYYRLLAKIFKRLLLKYSINSLIFPHDIISKSINKSSHLILQTKQEAHTFRKIFNTCSTPNTIIPNGVSNCFDCDADRNRSNYIFYPGTISNYKNQLIAAAVTNKMGVPLLLAGEIADSQYFRKIQEFENVKYLGVLKPNSHELKMYYNNAKITILISNGETFGLSILESLACGTPVIVTKNTAFKSIHNNRVIRYIDQNNPSELEFAIKYFFSEPPHFNECSNETINFRWHSIAKDLEEIYLCYRK